MTTSGLAPFEGSLGDIAGLEEPERLELALLLPCIVFVSANLPVYSIWSPNPQTYNNP